MISRVSCSVIGSGLVLGLAIGGFHCFASKPHAQSDAGQPSEAIPAYVRGRRLEAEGKWQEAIDAYGATEPGIPDEVIKDGQNRRKRLMEKLGQLPKPPPPDKKETLPLAQRLKEEIVRLEALQKLPPAKVKDAQWLHDYGVALFRSRNRYEDAARALKRAATLKSATADEDRMMAARALWRAGKPRDAAVMFEQNVRLLKQDAAYDARFFAAKAWLDADPKQGLKRLDKLVREASGVDPAHKREAAWILAWSSVTDKHWDAALKHITLYGTLASTLLERTRAAYWLAYVQAQLGHNPEAISGYKEIITKTDPLGWYALLAAHRLSVLQTEPDAPWAGVAEAGLLQSTAPPPLDLDVLPEASQFYARWAFTDEAVSSLRRQEEKFRKRVGTSDALMTLVDSYHAMGEFYRPYQLVLAEGRDKLAAAPEQKTLWAWRASHPRPWTQTIEGIKPKHQLPELLIYGVMRQESGFSKSVVSPVGAVGLLQLMPETANKVARRLGQPTLSNNLTNPEANITLGGAYMSELLRQYKGHPALAIAAYNAGSERVSRWLKGTHAQEIDAFVESIPYDETRNYVRRVVGHWSRYRFLYARDGSWWQWFSLKFGP